MMQGLKTPELPPTHRSRLFALIAFLVLCLIIMAAGGAVTATSVQSWYPGLQKPFFTPPNWLFGPAWSVIYFLIAIAGWRAWTRRHVRHRHLASSPTKGELARQTSNTGKLAFGVYGAQLLLNLAWSFLFFGAQSPMAGLIDIVPLLVLIIFNIILFYRIDRLAGLLLLPYALWVSYATALNASIWWLNG